MCDGCQQNNERRNCGIFVFMIIGWGVIYSKSCTNYTEQIVEMTEMFNGMQ